MKIKVSELSGAMLDWAVAQCEGKRTYIRPYEHTLTGLCILDADLVDMDTDGPQELNYSTDWAQGGAIIEKRHISIRAPKPYWEQWGACIWIPSCIGAGMIEMYSMNGDVPLQAAMRCYCSAKLGDEIDVPEEFETA